MGKHIWDIDFPTDYAPMMEVCIHVRTATLLLTNTNADNPG